MPSTNWSVRVRRWMPCLMASAQFRFRPMLSAKPQIFMAWIWLIYPIVCICSPIQFQVPLMPEWWTRASICHNLTPVREWCLVWLTLALILTIVHFSTPTLKTVLHACICPMIIQENQWKGCLARNLLATRYWVWNTMLKKHMAPTPLALLVAQ